LEKGIFKKGVSFIHKIGGSIGGGEQHRKGPTYRKVGSYLEREKPHSRKSEGDGLGTVVKKKKKTPAGAVLKKIIAGIEEKCSPRRLPVV